MSLLVVCDHDRGTLAEASLEALAFGRPPSREERKPAETTIQNKGIFALCHTLLNANEFVYID